ncbi:MAG: CoA transferase, partial [Thermoleophilia bacterium]|nr:CoA transferase [Thermoleophilia bacterium]
LKDETDKDVLVGLVERADVLVENFRPGVMERLGLGIEELMRRNPRLVVLSITGFGHDGPEGGRAGYDQIAQGEAGLMSLTGSGPDDPQRVGVPIADLLSGMYGAYGVLAALHERERTGKGTVVRTSLLASVVGVHAFQGTRWTVAGQVGQAQGNHHPSIAPYGLFRCRDGAVQISVGSEGPQVRRLQVALRRQGFGLSSDGAFGPQTRQAVVRYQRREGLPVSGTADVTLLRRLSATRARHLVVFPVPGPHAFSNDFGAPRHQGRHEGIDILAARGTPVVAVADGVIDSMSRADTGLGGIRLWLKDDAGTRYYYAHLSSIAPELTIGSRVAAGRRIGAVGRTGDARGGVFHLHFEMHPGGGRAVNPYPELFDLDTGGV